MELDASEQDAIASLVLAELDDELAWDEAFESHLGTLRELASQAREQHRRGETEPIVPGEA
jgi:hypothetical protein